MNPTGIHEDSGSIPGLTPWAKHCCELWCGSKTWFGSCVAVAVAVAAAALIQPLAWELPYAADAALKKKKKKKEKKRKENTDKVKLLKSSTRLSYFSVHLSFLLLLSFCPSSFFPTFLPSSFPPSIISLQWELFNHHLCQEFCELDFFST